MRGVSNNSFLWKIRLLYKLERNFSLLIADLGRIKSEIWERWMNFPRWQFSYLHARTIWHYSIQMCFFICIIVCIVLYYVHTWQANMMHMGVHILFAPQPHQNKWRLPLLWSSIFLLWWIFKFAQFPLQKFSIKYCRLVPGVRVGKYLVPAKFPITKLPGYNNIQFSITKLAIQ